MEASNYNKQEYNNPIINRVMTDVQKFSSDMTAKVEKLETSSGIAIILDYFGVAFSGVIDMIKLFVKTVPNTIVLTLNWLSTEIGLPNWFVAGIITISFITIISYIVLMLLKVRF